MSLRALVNEQAEDEGLWFIAETVPEAYLQQELRRLHAAIEAAPPLDVYRLAAALNGDQEIAVPLGHDLLPLAKRILARLSEDES